MGLADTNDVREVASIFLGKCKDGIVDRGPLPLERVKLALYGCVIQEERLTFHKNACELSSIKCQVQLHYLSFGVKGDCLELQIGNKGPVRTALSEQVCSDDYYYPVVACLADKGVYSLPDVCPCLNMNEVLCGRTAQP